MIKLYLGLVWKVIKQMFNTAKFWLLSLLWIGGIIDVLTTLPRIQLESNPLFFIGGFWLMIIVKVLGLMLISGVVFRLHRYGENYRFMLITSVVVVVCMQFLAGLNNYSITQVTTSESVGAETISEKLDYVNSYFMFVINSILYPMLISFLSFIFYKKINKDIGVLN